MNQTNDANTFVTSGHYRWDSSSYLPANCPSVNAAGEIEVIAFGYLVFQTLRTNQGNVWQRAKWSTNAWTSWTAVSTDIPSFYKNYSDIASLASALGVWGRVTNVPANSDLLQYIINPGIYAVNNMATARTITNGPITDGGYSVIVHRHHSSANPVIAVAYCNTPQNIPKVAVKAYVADLWGEWAFLAYQ